MKLPYELEKELNDLKLKFKSKGFIIKNVDIEKQEFDFWDLYYNRQPVSKKRNEDDRPFDYDPHSSIIR